MGKLNFGILGFGSFAERRLIPGFERSELAEVIAITKRNETKAKDKAKQFGIPFSYSYDNLDAFLNTPDMEAVFVASSNNVHMNDAIACLKAGKHVILEKPMAMNAEECDKINIASKKYGKEIMIAQCLRYNETVKYIKKVIDDGLLGSLVSCTCDFLSDGKASDRYWKYDKKVAGGGAAFDLGVHTVDTIRFICQKQLKRVFCSKIPRNLGVNDVDEVANFLLEFEDDFIAKSTSSFRGTRNLLIEFYGEKGYIRAFDWNHILKKIRVETEINSEFKRFEVQNTDMYAMEIDDFCKCIKGEIQNPISGNEGLINQKIIDMVNTNQDILEF